MSNRFFKKTRVGKLPNDWDSIHLQDLCIRIQDGTHFSPQSNSGKYKYLTSKNIKYGRIDLSDCGYISEEEHQNIYKRCPVQYNDILVTKDGANTGNAALNTLKEQFSLLSSVTMIRANPQKTTNEFLLQYILSPHGQYIIKSEMAGQAITRITLKTIRSFYFPVPPLPEQKKIAEILSKWDEGIETVEKLIATKIKMKKALMQQLLTGKKRFGGFEKQSWNSIELKNILVPQIRALPKPSQPYLSLGIRSHGKGTFQKPNFEPQKIALEELYKVKTNDLIVNITFAWEGAIAIVKECDDDALVSHRFPTYVFDKKKGIPEYFRHIILQKRFVYELGLVSPGGAGRNRVLSKKDFLKIKIDIPTVEEQRKIASALNTADKEIELLNKKLEALKQQKIGLMQKLLTGKIRVRINS